MFPRDTYRLNEVFERFGIDIPLSDVNTLRRAEKTLRNWYTAECGTSDSYYSTSIERDEDTGVPYRCAYPHQGKAHKYQTRIPDWEKGARARVADVCTRNGLYCYIQTDPRGGALYVSCEPLDDQNYTIGVGMYA